MKKARRNVVGYLTDRELRLVALRCSGLKPQAIGERMGISTKAVYPHLQDLLQDGFQQRGVDEAMGGRERPGRSSAARTPEDMHVPVPKVRRTTRIRMNRVSGSRSPWG